MNITYKGVTKDLKYYKGLKWNKALTPKMKEFQKKTGKNPVYRGIITGTFEYWMYWRNSKKTTTKKANKKKRKLNPTQKKRQDKLKRRKKTYTQEKLLFKTEKGYEIKLKEKGKWLSYEEISTQIKEVVEKDKSVKPIHKDIRRYLTWQESKRALEEEEEKEKKVFQEAIKSGKIKYYDDRLTSKIRSLKIQITKYKNIPNQEFVNSKRKELAETEQKLEDYYTHQETIRRLENQLYSLENEEIWGFYKEAADKRQENLKKRREINEELKKLKRVKIK